MLSLNEAREFLRIDGTENDNIINALLNAIPSYIEITTGMTTPQQSTEEDIGLMMAGIAKEASRQ